MELKTAQNRDFSGIPSTTRLRSAQHDMDRRVNCYIITNNIADNARFYIAL